MQTAQEMNTLAKSKKEEQVTRLMASIEGQASIGNTRLATPRALTDEEMSIFINLGYRVELMVGQDCHMIDWDNPLQTT
jgi:hypothetical protein